MTYYFSTILDCDFDTAIRNTTEALAKEGFGIITEIDVTGTFRKKLDVDFRPYRILGACNPRFAYEALSAEDKIGTMLPCNVIVQQLANGKIEVAAIDPVASMQAVSNDALGKLSSEVRKHMERVISSLT